MKLINIDSLDLPELQIYKTLRDKIMREDNSFIADSPKVINILLEQHIKVKSILATQEYYDTYSSLLQSKEIEKCYLASKDLMQTLVGHKIHHNAMMHGIRPNETKLEDFDEHILMLDNITSNENIGAIARSCAGLGVKSYLLPKSSPHPFSRRALRVSMGYSSYLKINIYDDILQTITQLKMLGYTIYAAELTKDSIALNDIEPSKKWVILMGHEGHGISQEILDVCDYIVKIEMNSDVKSFNVAIASSLMMYKFKNSILP